MRTVDRGGSPRDQILEKSRPLRGLTLLLFVHGFNVNEVRALEQWSHLRTLIVLPPRAQSGVFLWPSDRYGSQMISRLYYPAMVERAGRVGRALGAYLRDRGHDCILIGHSLGALVVVEAANRFLGLGAHPPEGERVLRGIGLLGAAVPVDQMRLGTGAFGIPLAHREGVAFSSRDPVLKKPFGVGAWLVSPFFPRSEAVGLHGAPEDRWLFRRDFEIEHHEHWRVDKLLEFVADVWGPSSIRTPRQGSAPPERTVKSRPLLGTTT